MDLAGLAIKHVLYPLWAAKNDASRLRHLAELEKSQYWPRQVHLDRQWVQIRALLAHAFDTCPYYRRKYAGAGIAPGDIRSPEDLDRLPPLTKEEIQEHRDELVFEIPRAPSGKTRICRSAAWLSRSRATNTSTVFESRSNACARRRASCWRR